MIFGLVPKSSTEPAGGNAVAMAYIVTKQNRFYVVTYDGIDPNTGRERRRWHLAGESREDAETIAANLTHRTAQVRVGACSAATVISFVSEVWMPKRVQHLRPSTAHRYRWMIDNYITQRPGGKSGRKNAEEPTDLGSNRQSEPEPLGGSHGVEDQRRHDETAREVSVGLGATHRRLKIVSPQLRQSGGSGSCLPTRPGEPGVAGRCGGWLLKLQRSPERRCAKIQTRPTGGTRSWTALVTSGLQPQTSGTK